MSANFQVGDQVTWTSQAGGHTKTKAGTVVAVVPAGAYPDREKFPRLYRSAGVGLKRGHLSYVVHVVMPSGRGAGTVYWPRAAALALAAGADASAPRALPGLWREKDGLAGLVRLDLAAQTPGMVVVAKASEAWQARPELRWQAWPDLLLPDDVPAA